MRYSRVLLSASFFLFVFSLSTPSIQGEVVKVTSNPSEAKVEIDGVAVGMTPYATRQRKS